MKQLILDKKRVIYKNNLKTVPKPNIVNNILKKIPDNPKFPLIFMTRKQYINEYANNQEKIKNIKYSQAQKQNYYNQEKNEYRFINSKYTTKKNPYYKPAYIVFNDKKISSDNLRNNLYHEYGHEEWEKNKRLRNRWKQVNRKTSPTVYGKTSKEEDFAESYMLYKNGDLFCPKRKNIIEKDVSVNNIQSLFTVQKEKPSEILKNNSKQLYGFSNYNYAKDWQKKYGGDIFQVQSDKYNLDSKLYSRSGKYSDNEYIINNIVKEEKIEEDSNIKKDNGKNFIRICKTCKKETNETLANECPECRAISIEKERKEFKPYYTTCRDCGESIYIESPHRAKICNTCSRNDIESEERYFKAQEKSFNDFYDEMDNILDKENEMKTFNNLPKEERGIPLNSEFLKKENWSGIGFSLKNKKNAGD